MFERKYRITLLFNASKVYDRQVIQGIGEYLQASQCDWDVFLEEDFRCRIGHIRDWMGDGIIADFDDPDIASALAGLEVPVIGVGGSYLDEREYPDVPYVATDNYALVDSAWQHLRAKGLEHFAFYGLPETSWKRWARERESAFSRITAQHGYSGAVYRGRETNPETWQYDMNRLADWLAQLPRPVGIIAVTDARARHILQVCEHLNIMVPDKVAVVGIDNEDLTRYLTRVALSSVGQGTRAMGFQAARWLHQALTGHAPGKVRHLIPPTGVVARQSTDFHALKDPAVIQAMHYIRANACKGIKVDQVLDYVGISRSNLEKRFRKERGQSVHNEIHFAKLTRAQHLLRSGDLPIAEVASLCGYPSIHYLYSVFRRDLGITPKEFRDTRQQVA